MLRKVLLSTSLPLIPLHLEGLAHLKGLKKAALSMFLQELTNSVIQKYTGISDQVRLFYF